MDRARQDLSRADAELNRLAYMDSLTGLPNRISFEARLREAVAAGGGLSLLALNLDRLEHVNQLLGREQGDRVLQEAAQRLSRLLQSTPIPADQKALTLARLGGDEFAVLAPGADASSAAGGAPYSSQSPCATASRREWTPERTPRTAPRSTAGRPRGHRESPPDA